MCIVHAPIAISLPVAAPSEIYTEPSRFKRLSLSVWGVGRALTPNLLSTVLAAVLLPRTYSYNGTSGGCIWIAAFTLRIDYHH